MSFKNKITGEEIKELPLSCFEGRIVVVDRYRKVSGAVRHLRNSNVLGFDTETRPSFKKGKVNKVALLQLSCDDTAFLFRLNNIGLPDEVTALLADGTTKKIGAAIKHDITILRRLNDFQPAGFIDLQQIVKNYGIENFSLQKLAGIVLNIRVSKSQRLSNWEADVLSESQQRYAATDAWLCAEIYHRLMNETDEG